MKNTRNDFDLPKCIKKWGWKYHHLGIPTTQKRPDERHLPHLGMFVSGFTSSPYGVEWMRFETDSPIDMLIQTVPHLAFVVPDLDHELATRNFRVLTEPTFPSGGVRVAMIEHNGAPVELMEFEMNADKGQP